MGTQISSGMTFVMKVVFPVLWGGMWSVATGLLFAAPASLRSSGGGPPPGWVKWLCLGCLIVGATVISRVSGGLKRIVLEGNRLRISNYLREITVPLSDVARVGVDGSARVNNQPVAVLEFRRTTDFGDQVPFIPASQAAYATIQAAVERESGTSTPPAPLPR
jgi:hypothetical protein